MAANRQKTLSQALAVEKSIKTKRETDITNLYQDMKKEDRCTGFTRTYTPKTEDGEKLPPETKPVAVRVKDTLNAIREATKEIVNITSLKDATNMTAKASVYIDGVEVLTDVPAVHLLFLEKRFGTLLDIFKDIPVLTTDDTWQKNEGLGLYDTAPTPTFKTKKVESWKVIVQATEQHPAQAQKMTEDIVVGTWNSVRYSGAITADEKKALILRAEKALRAVKVAREEANQAVVVELATGSLIDYVFG